MYYPFRGELVCSFNGLLLGRLYSTGPFRMWQLDDPITVFTLLNEVFAVFCHIHALLCLGISPPKARPEVIQFRVGLRPLKSFATLISGSGVIGATISGRFPPRSIVDCAKIEKVVPGQNAALALKVSFPALGTSRLSNTACRTEEQLRWEPRWSHFQWVSRWPPGLWRSAAHWRHTRRHCRGGRGRTLHRGCG
jgi:hypothetical protein